MFQCRAKKKNSKKWVIGYYVKVGNKHCIQTDNFAIPIVIDPNTLGLETGMKDSKKKMIYGSFEYEKNKFSEGGDVVSVARSDSFPSWNKGVVVYDKIRASFLLMYLKPINPKGILADCVITNADKTRMFGYLYQWKLTILKEKFTYEWEEGD